MTTSQPSVFYITLDSVRMDHTSLNGYERDTTPNLKLLTSSPDGVSFDHCIAHGTRTPVSAPSMLTGLVPSRHRIGLGRGGENLGKVPKSMKTAQELFEDLGYNTIGISDNGVIEATGLDTPFGEYKKVPMMISDLMSYPDVLSGIRYMFNTKEHGPGMTIDRSKYGHQTTFILNDIAKRKLKKHNNSSDPVFCYMHYNDTHNPYLPPLNWIGEYLDTSVENLEEARTLVKSVHEQQDELIANGLQFSDTEWETIRSMYDSTLKYVDSSIGSIIDFIQHRFDNPIIIVTADHGDLFGEQGLLDHGSSIHDGLIHVPLVVWGIPELERRSNSVVQHIDIMKTLFSIVGGDTAQIQGFNLLENEREFAVSQVHHPTVADDEKEDYKQHKRYNPEFDDSHLHHSLLTSVRTTDFKLYHSTDRSELYELPDESTDVKDKYPEIRDRLSTFVKRWLKTEGTPFKESPEESELSNEARHKLEAMGYI